MPEPTFCQSAYGCEQPRVYTARFKSQSGYEWSEGLCRRDASVRADQVRAEGGSLVAVEEIPQTPSPSPTSASGAAQRAEAVSDDPNAETGAPEPVSVRVPRRRRKAKG